MKPEPCSSFWPDLVIMLIMLDPDRPTSAVNLLVAIWNSCTLSCGKFANVPPTTSSLLSPPSTLMLPPRPKAPAEETSRVLVFVGSKLVAGRFPGIRNASSRKFLPLSGRLWMVADVIKPCTSDCVRSTRASPTITVTVSPRPASASLTSCVTAWPTSSRISFTSAGAKDVLSTFSVYSPGNTFAKA